MSRLARVHLDDAGIADDDDDGDDWMDRQANATWFREVYEAQRKARDRRRQILAADPVFAAMRERRQRRRREKKNKRSRRIGHRPEYCARHKARVRAHAQRVGAELARQARIRQARGGVTATSSHRRGVRRAVWCVELGVRYYSACQAARFHGGSACNICTAIRCQRTSCGYHWQIYDPDRHGPAIASEAAGE